jgi:hypothetical protein
VRIVAHPPPRSPGRPGAPQKPGTQPGLEDSLALKRASEVLSDETYQTEEDLEALKARYEMYFLGIEKREPARERWEMKRRVERLKESFTKNTGLRFRLQTLHARFLSYERLWMRSAREKEEGTYRRDVFKARLRAKDAAKAEKAPAPEGSREKAPGAVPAVPRAGAAPSTPPTFAGPSCAPSTTRTSTRSGAARRTSRASATSRSRRPCRSRCPSSWRASRRGASTSGSR